MDNIVYFPNQTEEQKLALIELVDNTALGIVFSAIPDGMSYDELKSLLEEEDHSLWELNDFCPWVHLQDVPLGQLAEELEGFWDVTYATLERALAIVQ